MNWIKMTENLDTKPEVMMLADALGVHELHAVGLLWKLWTWLDQNITDCYAVTVTRALLDRITCAGMSDALQKVGWLSGEDGALIFANFDRHNGKTAKERACSAKRMNGKRQRDAVTEALQPERNSAVTREEKRREEKKIPPNPQRGDARGTAPAPARTREEIDDAWVTGLAENTTYLGIDVRRELGKMCAWCVTNHKKPTRRRFMNWLNRAEQPLLGFANQQTNHQPPRQHNSI